MYMTELERLNQLARQARSAGLSAHEALEQQRLRQRYLEKIRGQITSMLSTVTVLDAHGNDVTPMKLRDAQAQGMPMSF